MQFLSLNCQYLLKCAEHTRIRWTRSRRLRLFGSTLEPIPTSAHVAPLAAVDCSQISSVSTQRLNPWVSSARFLAAWLFPALLGFYLKWYMMTDQGGFAREARSMGLQSLNLYQRSSFFRGELFYGALLIPLFLLVLNRYLRAGRWAILTGSSSLVVTFLLGVQILSLRELGRFSSLKMILVALSWGWHEPGSNLQYLMSREAVATFISVIGIGAAHVWAVRNASRATSATPPWAGRLLARCTCLSSLRPVALA